MAEIKKYLDQEGVEHLWSKLSMEDYPNNETLMAVITAIDETKADKSEIENFLTEEQINDAIAQKSQVQIVTQDIPEFLPTLAIHKLTQDEYEQKLEAGTLDENALYLTPDEEIDLSSYATEEYVDNAISSIPTPDVSGQISAAIADIDYPVDSVNGKTGAVNLTSSDVGVYVQADEPTSPVEGDIWLDTDKEGASGSSGKSAYDYAVEGGYEGTEEEFAKKLAAPLNYVTPEMFGAKGDGVTDDREAINEAIKASNVVNLSPYKTYLISADQDDLIQTKRVGILTRDNLIINGNNATIKVKTTERSTYNAICCYGNKNVTIRDLNIEGESDTHQNNVDEYGHGLGIYACENVLIENCHISKCIGDGLYIAAFDSSAYEDITKNVNIVNCQVYDCWRNGITITHADGVTISNCHISNIYGSPIGPWACIDVEPNMNMQKAININIIDCILDNEYVGVSVDGYNGADKLDVTVNGCTIYGNIHSRMTDGSGNKFYLLNSKLNYIRVNNKVDSVLIVKGCTIMKQADSVAIEIIGTDENTLTEFVDVVIDCYETIDQESNGKVPIYVTGTEKIYNVHFENVVITGGAMRAALYNPANAYDKSCFFNNVRCSSNLKMETNINPLGDGVVKNIYNMTIREGTDGIYLGLSKYVEFNLTSGASVYILKNYMCDGEHHIINKSETSNVYIEPSTEVKVFKDGQLQTARITIAPGESVCIGYCSKTNKAVVV